MDALNMPLEMIAVCSPDGELSPARFRLETESGERVTVRIRQISRREEIRLMGVESIRFDCLALLGGRLRRFSLGGGLLLGGLCVGLCLFQFVFHVRISILRCPHLFCTSNPAARCCGRWS